MRNTPHGNIYAPYAPTFLQNVPQWICWRKEQRAGRWTKVPYDPKTGTHARTNDPTTWCSYKDARLAWERDFERYDGLGFVFHGDFTGVDLDHCVAPDGSIADWALAYIKRLNTYAERSPHDGIHLYITGTIPKGLRRRIPNASHPEAALEMYCSGRYFTVTGRYLQGMPLTAEPRTREIMEIYAELGGSSSVLHDTQAVRLISQDAMMRASLVATQPALSSAQDAMTRAALAAPPSAQPSAHQAMEQAALAATQPALHSAQDAMTRAALQAHRVGFEPGMEQRAAPGHAAQLSDRELVRHAATAANGAAFKALWLGDTTGYLSHSEADLALCGYLAFWTGYDAARVDRLFRRSHLYRPEKWNRPARSGQTYGQGTVARACTSQAAFPTRLARSTAKTAREQDATPAPQHSGTPAETPQEPCMSAAMAQQARYVPTEAPQESCMSERTPQLAASVSAGAPLEPCVSVEIARSEPGASVETPLINAGEEATRARVEYLYAQTESLEDQWWRPDSLPALELSFVQRCLEQNEDGDALLFAHLFKDRCVYDYINRLWYLWQGHFWQEDRSKRVPRLVCEYVAHVYENAALRTTEPETRKNLHGRAWALRTVSRIKHVLALAESIMPISAEQWDTNDWLLGTREGVIDLRTGELRDGRPADYIRRVVHCAWRGLDEPAPRFEQFWRDIFADRPAQARDELVAFLQRVLGYGITGRVSEHIFLLFYGEEGRNGKDTLMQVLADVLGETVGVVNNDVLIAGGRSTTPGSANSSLCQLQGRRIAWASETNQGARFDIGQVKYLTGGGAIAARELYGKAFSFQPSHLLILLTNHKPHADASDAAFWERLCPIIFNQRFVDQPAAPNERQRDTTLGAALKAEASGILAWLVRGCLAWQRHGLALPPEIRQARHDYHEEEDTLGSFMRECCTLDPQASTPAAALYTAYKSWALANGLKTLSSQTFGMQMKKRVKWKRFTSMSFYMGVKVLTEESSSPPM